MGKDPGREMIHVTCKMKNETMWEIFGVNKLGEITIMTGGSRRGT